MTVKENKTDKENNLEEYLEKCFKRINSNVQKKQKKQKKQKNLNPVKKGGDLFYENR